MLFYNAMYGLRTQSKVLLMSQKISSTVLGFLEMTGLYILNKINEIVRRDNHELYRNGGGDDSPG